MATFVNRSNNNTHSKMIMSRTPQNIGKFLDLYWTRETKPTPNKDSSVPVQPIHQRTTSRNSVISFYLASLPVPYLTWTHRTIEDCGWELNVHPELWKSYFKERELLSNSRTNTLNSVCT